MNEIKIKTVKDLKRSLCDVDEDMPIYLQVDCDNCTHLQEIESIYVFYDESDEVDEYVDAWCTLIGKMVM